MRSFFDWIAEEESRRRAWLVYGKGPSFSTRHRFDTSSYNVLSLNHAVREVPVDVAHVIDLDVVEAAADAIEGNARYLAMPWQPHVKNRPGRRTLDELLADVPVLARLSAAGRLLYYDFCSGKRRSGHGPVVQARYFSAEAALSLLALAGVRQVRSLGIDGGRSYGTEFTDLRDKTLLNNGHQNFDIQFRGIARTIMTSGIDYAPLDVEAPVRVYVGSQDAQMLSVKVLEYSIRKHASLTVEVHPLHVAGADIRVPMPQALENRPRTPFSFQRFYIPQLAGFRGRAIYVDSDMQVFRDIRQLWTLPFGDADLLAAREPGESGRKPQFSVMLLNCDRLRWNLDDIVARLDRGELTYKTLMYDMAVAEQVAADIDPSWNSLERYVEGETSLLHYTDMNTQPWISRENPLGYLWCRDLLEAVDSGFIPADYVREHVRLGYVRPSLVYQIEHRAEDPLLLPRSAQQLDAGFTPPYKALATRGQSGGAGAGPLRIVRAALRQIVERSGLRKVERRLRGRTS